ncbi:hypothetical protein [uncultured Alistipes sp.]|jgi:hypothetical protein|uniref:hypothetical protein n=1 Tax=uncultured Alistipes sp. TaxID=538949 RepID=UPI0026194134|nr:hypothetical protein [uncultured Alistipes sp.]
MKNSEYMRLRREFICDVTRLLYDPGSHTRSKMWIWRNFILPVLGIGYQTYLKESKADVAFDPDRMSRLVAAFELLTERGHQALGRTAARPRVPGTAETEGPMPCTREEVEA